jgi:hypothetical protein
MRKRKARRRHDKARDIARELAPKPEIDVRDPKIQRGCVGKRVYLSKHRARVAISRVRKVLDREMGMYHCRVCGKYHLATVKEEVQSPEPVEMSAPIIQATNPTIRTLAGTTLKPMMKRATA